MFSRYRRNNSANSSGGVPQSTTNGSRYGRRISNANNANANAANNNNNSYSDTEPIVDHSAAAAASLEELRNALNRLEYLTDKIANDDENTATATATAGASAAGGGSKGGKAAAATPTKMARGKVLVLTTPKKGADNTTTEKKEKDESVIVNGDNGSISAAAHTENSNTKNQEGDQTHYQTTIKKNIERSPSAAASDIRQNTNANFLAVSQSDEDEMIELIRRIAELVVLSERKATQLLTEADNAAADEAKANNKGDDNAARSSDSQSGGEGTGEKKEDEEEEEEMKMKKKKMKKVNNDYNEDVALPYLALFELFCERNALANIVNVVTGVAFIPRDDGPKDTAAAAAHQTATTEGESDDTTKPTATTMSTPSTPPFTITRTKSIIPYLLPPLTIATQAVQSISILIQNVSRATSLYFLLSNNRVNDLIKLPLHLYKRAELNVLHKQYYNKGSGNNKRGSKQQRQQPSPNYLLQYQSSEMGELTTHFVSFLKSLAMRVNAETLQFFLSFPLNETMSSSNNNNNAKVKDDKGEAGENGEKAVLGGEGDGNGDRNSDAGAQDSAAGGNQSLPLSYLERRKVVEFPLYARALEFCSTEQDSFVRVTAMNVCMNIIRLATVCGHDENVNVCDDDGDGSSSSVDDDDGYEGDVDRQRSGKSGNDGEEEGNNDSGHSRESTLPTATPSGTLDKTPPLPIQDRIAIAQYACHPSRVSDLVTPLCARLTSQFGLVEGTVRTLEELNNKSGRKKSSSSAAAANSPKMNQKIKNQQQKQQQDEAKERSRLQNSIEELIANVQDELLLLEDLLKLGLISLNEQSIEMMLATFVYPMLLQPLLLPLHRFNSLSNNNNAGEDGVEGGEDGSTAKIARTPVITLLAPVPFSSNSTSSSSAAEERNDMSNKKIGEPAVSNGDSSGPAQPSIDEDDSLNPTRTYSSNEMDLAPSKTALFGISVIFHTVSNPTFRHLLLTALLHPLSPEASGGAVISALPKITLPKGTKIGKRSSSDDLGLEIRMEENQAQRSKENEKFQNDVNVYTFGTGPGEEDGRANADIKGFGNNMCVFILAPALVDMLRSNTGSKMTTTANNVKNGLHQVESSTSLDPTATRPNPYRSILMASISGSDEMVALQPLAIAALHSAVSSVDCSITRSIIFSPKPLDSMKLTLQSLCNGIVSTMVTYDGWWKVKFNTVAARTLMDIVSKNFNYIACIEAMVAKVRLQAAQFLMTLPSHLDKKSQRSDEGDAASPKHHHHKSSGDKQQLETWLLDRFFFDQADKHSNSVVENVCYLKEMGGDGAESKKEQYRYGLELLSKLSIRDNSNLLCEDRRVVENMILADEARGNTAFHCAASFALACLYLDAFCMKLSKMSAAFDVDGGGQSPQHRTLSYISSTGSYDSCDSNSGGYSLAHLSSKFAIAMLDEGQTSDKKSTAPAHGSAVGLVGKAAFPCVCEVSASLSPLFSGRTCISNEGIQWQSLYLVVVGKWCVLAEPGHGGTGGEGRVITACRLACLAIKKDSSSLVNNKTPARRLLVAHASLDPRPPALFVVDSSSSRNRGGQSGSGPSLGADGLRLTRSRMDLWFEDANAASHACRVLQAKIAKARARRGARIQTALLAR